MTLSDDETPNDLKAPSQTVSEATTDLSDPPVEERSVSARLTQRRSPLARFTPSLTGGDLKQRNGTFVSKHRVELDRIRDDSTKNRSHPVPERVVDMGEVRDKSIQRIREACRKSVTGKSPSDWLEVFLPAWRWLKVYQWKTTFLHDLIAGLSVGVMVIPQGMSYAKLAGLPVEFGLYTAFVPVYIYALFGSSRQLAVGPVAILSLLLSSGLTQMFDNQGITPDNNENYTQIYIQAAIQCTFLVGVICILLGLARLGFVTIFLSHAVISGFTTGASVIIGASQLKYIFGYSTPRSDVIWEILKYLFEDISQFNYKTFLMGTSAIFLLVLIKYLGKNYRRLKWVRPLGPLTVTVLGIVLVAAFGLDKKGIPIVGTIPRGLPSFSATEWFPIQNFGQLFVVVISLVIVGFSESIAIAKQLAAKHKYEIDSSMELIGLGMANFVGAMFQAYPSTGSFSRSAVNHDSGAQSGMAGIVTATLVGLVLLLLTSIFEKLPLNILAAIVIAGVIGLLDYPEAIRLWKVHKFDFFVWMSACLGTLFLGVEIGLAIAVGVSILIVIYESAYPHTAVLGRLPGTTVYRNVKQYPEAERVDGLIIVRIDSPLYFANAQNIREKIRKYRLATEKEMTTRNVELKYVIMDLTPVGHVDTSALHILDDMLDNHRSRGQELIFSNPSLLVMERFVTSGFADRVGREHFFSCVQDAVNWCLAELDVEALSVPASNHGRDSPEMSELDIGESLRESLCQRN